MYTIPSHVNLVEIAYANIIHDAAYLVIKDETIKKILKKTKFFLLCNVVGTGTYKITRNIIVDTKDDIPTNFINLEGCSVFTNECVSIQLRNEQITAKIKLLLP